jgi:hypothetical protein
VSLTEMQHEVLDFEQGRWRFLGAKEAAVRDRWDISLTRYNQILNDLLDNPDAYVVNPPLIKRLRRLREQRRLRRAG